MIYTDCNSIQDTEFRSDLLGMIKFRNLFLTIVPPSELSASDEVMKYSIVLFLHIVGEKVEYENMQKKI